MTLVFPDLLKKGGEDSRVECVWCRIYVFYVFSGGLKIKVSWREACN